MDRMERRYGDIATSIGDLAIEGSVRAVNVFNDNIIKKNRILMVWKGRMVISGWWMCMQKI